MNKPLSMTYEEFKQGLSSLINNSGLPVIVIESVLQNYLNEVNNVVKNQYLLDKEKYEKSLKIEDGCDETRQEENRS